MERQSFYVSDLSKEEIAIYEERCRPDHDREKNSQIEGYGTDFYSDTGFIDDTESLSEVCAQDNETVVNALDKDGHEIIAKTLLCVMLHDQVDYIKEKFPDMYIDIHIENFQVKRESSWCGSQLCPFVNKFNKICVRPNPIPNYAAVDYSITNKLTKETLKVNLLFAHLIYCHHFYEGHVEHRISPTKLIDFFGLKRPIISEEV